MSLDSTVDVPLFGILLPDLEGYEKYLLLARRKFKLDINHIHGERHWIKVIQNARRIVKADGGDLRVATLFGIFHDCCRENDRYDPHHGKRAAEYVDKQNLSLTTKQRDLLWQAIRGHNKEQVSADPTIGACWDADRLDLPRVGTKVNPEYLSTDEGYVILKEQLCPK